MLDRIRLGDITVEVVRKSIKNVHLSVYPPDGRVRVAAPERMSLESVRAFLIAKLPWIRRQRQQLREQEREAPREYLDRESHHVWGTRYLLKIVESDGPAGVRIRGGRLLLHIQKGANSEKRKAVLEGWYRQQIRAELPPLLERWQTNLGVNVRGVFVQRMKTRWGSCNHEAGTIRLNTDLAKKPRECLEYILVHELAHLLEPKHDARFVALMDKVLPAWPHRRDELNRLPVRHEEWLY